jgi:hypothetical protein
MVVVVVVVGTCPRSNLNLTPGSSSCSQHHKRSCTHCQHRVVVVVVGEAMWGWGLERSRGADLVAQLSAPVPLP